MPNRFGLGWNISDILGGLGDAISVGAGGDANYLNQVQRDRYGAGLDQFLGGDEQGGLKSLAQSGGPTAANQFYDNYGTNMYRRATAANQAEDNRRQAQVEADKRDAATEARLAGIFRGATPGDWQQRRQIAQQYAQQRGYDISRANIPEQYKEGWATQYDQSLLEPKDYAADQRGNRQIDETARYHDIQDENADATRLVNAKLGQARVQATLAGQQAGNYRTNVRAGTAAQAEAGRNARSKNTGGQTIDGYNLRPGKRVGGTATLPSGKVVTWDGTKWK